MRWRSGGCDELVPCFHSGGREVVGGRGRPGAVVDACLTGDDLIGQGRLLSADDDDRAGVGVCDEARLVVAKDELPDEREGLRLERQTIQNDRGRCQLTETGLV